MAKKQVMQIPEIKRPEKGLVGGTPKVNVKKKDLAKYPPDTIEEYIPVAHGRGKKVWVKDASLLKSIEGTNQTLMGTEYYGELL